MRRHVLASSGICTSAMCKGLLLPRRPGVTVDVWSGTALQGSKGPPPNTTTTGGCCSRSSDERLHGLPSCCSAPIAWLRSVGLGVGESTHTPHSIESCEGSSRRGGRLQRIEVSSVAPERRAWFGRGHEACLLQMLR